MNKKAMFISLAAVLVIIVGGIIYTSNKQKALEQKMEVSAAAPTDESSQMDARFMEQMIPHHKSAVAMAEIAINKSQRAEVKQLAKNIIEAQNQEIGMMESWYSEWFGADIKSGTEANSGMMMSHTQLTQLENSKDFDKDFVSEMIMHHTKAVEMAESVLKTTNRQEIRDLSQAIVIAQKSEIDQMNQWLKNW